MKISEIMLDDTISTSIFKNVKFEFSYLFLLLSITLNLRFFKLIPAIHDQSAGQIHWTKEYDQKVVDVYFRWFWCEFNKSVLILNRLLSSYKK